MSGPAYGRVVADLYNRRFSRYAAHDAHALQLVYEATCREGERSVLDMCCGTGPLAPHFIREGYRYFGFDASAHMLTHARHNLAGETNGAQANFLEADVRNFDCDERFGLVIAHDCISGFADEQSLRACFECARKACTNMFVFDLVTHLSLARSNVLSVDDSEEDLLLNMQGLHRTGDSYAWRRVFGFLRNGEGHFERFNEIFVNRAHAVEQVVGLLHDVGWQEIRLARLPDLRETLDRPEEVPKFFVICTC